MTGNEIRQFINRAEKEKDYLAEGGSFVGLYITEEADGGLMVTECMVGNSEVLLEALLFAAQRTIGVTSIEEVKGAKN